MLSRFVIAVLLASILPGIGHSQENNEVLLGSIRGAYSLMACGRDGQTYFRHDGSFPDGHAFFVQGVSRDGSIVTFRPPDRAIPILAARDGSNLSVLTQRSAGPHLYEMEIYEIDDQANVLAHHPVTLDFYPWQMAVLPSGETIVAGHLENVSWSHRKEWTYVGAVLDADGRTIDRFDFPSPPDGGKWTLPSRQKMVGGDGAAYIVLETDSESAIGIAKISGTGQVDIKIIPEPPDDDQRIHRTWLLGPGTAVEEYNYTGKKSHRMRYDEYDLNSGQKIATKVSPGGSAQCYFGTDITWTTTSAHVDPARHPSPETLWLVFSKLENQAGSAPPVNH